MIIIDLFAGVGGLSYGFKMAGFEIAVAIESDSNIAESYKKNNPETKVISEDIQKLDITKIHEDYPDISVVIGGPPCQGFSQKGKRLNFQDDRNYLFRYFLNTVSIIKPKFFLLENVPNILSTANGYFKNQLIKEFSDLGYEVTYKILNANDFGVPQLRKRAFILGQLKKLEIDLPSPNGLRTSVKEAIYDLPFIKSGEGKEFYEYENPPMNEYQKNMRSKSKKIYNHKSTNHSDLVLKRMKLIPKGKGKEVLPKEHLTKSIYSGTWCRLIEDNPAVTITTRFDTPSSGMFTHPTLNRCLTVREAARIQSFPDNYIFYGNKSSQMKQVGNAVPPLVAYEIAKKIKEGFK